MVGHAQLTIEKAPYQGEQEAVLEVKDYKLPRLGGGYTVDHVSFTLHRGEVLGIYGLMGAGRTELVESLMGLHPGTPPAKWCSTAEAITHPVVSEQIARGMVLGCQEDRQKDGLVQCMSIYKNMRLDQPKAPVQPRRRARAAVLAAKWPRPVRDFAGHRWRCQPPGHGALGRQPAESRHRQVRHGARQGVHHG